MEIWSRVLYGSFPRKIGGPGETGPNQFSVFTEEHFDRAVEKSNQQNNVYCSISRLPVGPPETDKVFFDLDAKVPASLEGKHESEQFEIMRQDSDVADEVLGNVVDDMHKLAEASIEDDIPVLGLFSGKGVHVHQLYQTETDAADEMRSIGNKYSDELELMTVDRKVFEPIRISKIPNSRRFDDGKETGVWTVPLTAEEMRTLTASELLELSRSPRDPEFDPRLLNKAMRPEMEVYEDYLGRRPMQMDRDHMEVGESLETDQDVEELVREFIDLPCIRERVLTRNPDHKVRWNFVVLMFNFGFTKGEVEEIIRKLSWKDYDPEMTRKQIESIWRGKKGDMSCMGIMNHGLCVYQDNPKECPTYSWNGGTQTY